MKIKRQITELMVEDVTKSIEFYTGFLGFEVRNKLEEAGKTVWAEVTSGPVVIQFLVRKTIVDEVPRFENLETGGTFIILLEVDNAKEIFDRLKDKVEIVDGYRQTDYGTREFKIADNSGYIIQITERVE